MAKRGSRALRFGLLSLVVSIACLIVGGFLAAELFSSLRGATIQPVPGTFAEELDPADYLVAVRPAEGVTIQEVVVTGPDGAAVTTTDGSNQSISRSAVLYRGVVVFEATTPGTYTVTVNADGVSEALVARSLQNLSGTDFIVFVVSIAGVVLFLLGLILIVVGLVRRRGSGSDSDGGGWVPPTDPSAYGGPGLGERYEGPSGGQQSAPPQPGQHPAPGYPPAQPGGWPQG